MRLDEVAHRLEHRCPQTGLVGAAVACGDAVDIGADRLVGGLGPGQRHLDADVVLPGDVERAGGGGNDGAAAPGDEFVEVFADTALVDELLLDGGRLRLVAEDEREAAVQVALRFEAVAHLGDVEGQLFAEDLGIGLEGDLGAMAATGAEIDERARRFARRVALLVAMAVALDLGDEAPREGVDDR